MTSSSLAGLEFGTPNAYDLPDGFSWGEAFLLTVGTFLLTVELLVYSLFRC